MYSHCLFCHADLGRNERIDVFPVGATLAFDGEHGRLWVVCPACHRWNLTPLEERWEAIESCERLFRDARLRVSTEQVGMARLPEGPDLIRIGRPLRPEMAAWRYGRTILARRGGRWLPLLGLGGTAALTAGSIVLGGGVLLLAPLAAAGAMIALGADDPDHPVWGDSMTQRLKNAEHLLRTAEGKRLYMYGRLASAQIRTGPDLPDGWELVLRTHPDLPLEDGPPRFDYRDPSQRDHSYTLRGANALHGAAIILRAANRSGASPRTVGYATRELERTANPARYFAVVEERQRRTGWGHRALWNLPVTVRLAMEMAAHEESERRAMQDDLAELETRWRQAEEIAVVADRLGTPTAVEARIAGWRGGRGG